MWLFRRGTRTKPEDPAGDGGPRPLHYAVAHQLLPAIILRRWDEVRPGFLDGRGSALLRALWMDAAKGLPGRTGIDPGGSLGVTITRAGDHDVFVVRFPKPLRVAEAALAVIPDRPAPTSYFVLELGRDFEVGRGRWVLCEWDAHAHHNLGTCSDDPGVDPDRALPAMLATIARLESPDPPPP